MLDLVRHRLGIDFVPESFRAQAPDLRFLRVREYVPGYQISIAAARTRPLSPVARTFLAAVVRRRAAQNRPASAAKPLLTSDRNVPVRVAPAFRTVHPAGD